MAKPWEKYQEPEEEEQEQGPWSKYQDMDLGDKIAADASLIGTSVESIARGAFDDLANYIPAAGNLVGDALAVPAAAVESVMTNIGERAARGNFDMSTGEPITPWGGFSQNLEAARGTFPATAFRNDLNPPSSLDAQAFHETSYHARTPGDYESDSFNAARPDVDIGPRFSQRRDDILEGYLSRREKHPIGAAGGDAFGDALAIITMRAKPASAQRLSNLRKAGKPQGIPDVPKSQKMTPSAKQWFQEQRESLTAFAKGSGLKVGEASLEGALIAGMNDEDPLTAALWGAGLQSGANLSQAGWREIPDLGAKGIAKPGVKLAIMAAGTAAMYQAIKELTPGGRDRILESEESGYKKAAMAVMLGASVHAAGFGRPSTATLNKFGAISDAWFTSRRGATLSLISQAFADETGELDSIMVKLGEDPNYFGPTFLRRYDRIDREGGDFKGMVESMSKADPRFRRKVMSLREQ